MQCRSADSSLQLCMYITLHLEQQSNVKNTVKNCKLDDDSYSTVLSHICSVVYKTKVANNDRYGQF